MSSKAMADVRNTLSFQLTCWYSALFALLSFFMLSVFYFMIRTAGMHELDESLMEEVQEMIVMNRSGDLEKVKDYMVVEVETEDEDMFYQLFASNGQLLAMKGNIQWENLKKPKLPVLVEAKVRPVYETTRIKGYTNRVRTVCGGIGDEKIMQVGKSMAEIDDYLSLFRNLIFLSVFPLIALSALVGWRISRHAMRGVEEVTRTAVEISGGSYEKRVHVHPGADEIARLANSFNAMLDRLQAVMKSMSEMTDNIAHDLRSPLARIRGFAEMALMRSSSVEEYETMAVNTIEECDNLTGMINTMLDITEMEAGINVLKQETVDVNKMVNDACELFDPIARERDIRILWNPDAPPLIFRTDRQKFQRLVTNLLENAIKYNKSGGRVTISVEAAQDRIRLTFEDTGIGIPEGELRKIFERFHRCDRSRSNSGIGLGLSLAKAIANALGGDIDVTSRENLGSTFVVSLPV